VASLEGLLTSSQWKIHCLELTVVHGMDEKEDKGSLVALIKLTELAESPRTSASSSHCRGGEGKQR
jgi:hypothetical protein